ncbi:MAG: hypothetical protein ABIT08_05490 [Bacteroidia bacterium]
MTSTRTNAKQRNRIKNINQKIKEINFDKHAKASGFKKRKAQKITGKTMVLAFILMAMQGNNSLQLWAEKIGILTGKTVSKQAIWKRITEALTKFLPAILLEALDKQIRLAEKDKCLQSKKLKQFKRVLIQDSTVIALPAMLSWCFPGNVSRGERKAQLKIQVVYDLLSNCFIYYQITPFTANDQSQSKGIMNIACKGDLVIRDYASDCEKTYKSNCITCRG